MWRTKCFCKDRKKFSGETLCRPHDAVFLFWLPRIVPSLSTARRCCVFAERHVEDNVFRQKKKSFYLILLSLQNHDAAFHNERKFRTFSFSAKTHSLSSTWRCDFDVEKEIFVTKPHMENAPSLSWPQNLRVLKANKGDIFIPRNDFHFMIFCGERFIQFRLPEIDFRLPLE